MKYATLFPLVSSVRRIQILLLEILLVNVNDNRRSRFNFPIHELVENLTFLS